MLIKKLLEIYNYKHPHFIHVEYNFYKNWKWIIKILVKLNKNYTSCEIFRKKYKIYKNIVVIGLKWSGKNVKRRTNGYAKEFISSNPNSKCIYCNTKLTNINATSDHIVPISNRGNNCQVNIVICCTDCNNERGNLPFNQYLKMKNINFIGKKDIFI